MSANRLSAAMWADEVVETVEAEMGAPAKGSAVEGITSGAWRALAEICGKTAEELYDPLCYIENAVTDTQVRRMSPSTPQPLHIPSTRHTAGCTGLH